MTREDNANLQLAPLLSKAQAFSLEARILGSKLCSDLVHRVRRPLEELFTKGTTLPSALEHILHITIFRWSMQRALRR